MDTHRNNVGLIRLVLASLVIIGHAPEMTDGNRHREPLTVLLGSLSLGELAVSGFFLLSGYLIAQSMMKTKSASYYLERRVFRIYPAFVVSYLLCVFMLGSIAGAHPWDFLPKTFARLLLLQDPMYYPGQFKGLHYPALNGSMWTIAYEFRCYLLVAILGTYRLLANKRIVLGLTGICIFFSVCITFGTLGTTLDAPTTGVHGLYWLIGAPSETIRLTAIFLVGVSFYICREALLPLLDVRTALFGTVIVVCLMYRNQHLATAAVAIFGSLPLFWLAFTAHLGVLQRINDKWDISYGTYLYGWPVAILILWLRPSISPWILATIALPVALLLGACSWWGVEKKTKDIRRSRSIAGPPEKRTVLKAAQ
jgi:peptidoglycan/LPS O-acetylase OafA/YrhL